MIAHKTHPRRKIVFYCFVARREKFLQINFWFRATCCHFCGRKSGESIAVVEGARCPFCEPLRPPLPAQPLQHRFPIFIAEIPTFWNDNLFLIVLILRSNCWCENPQNEKFKLTKAPGRDGKSENGKNSINKYGIYNCKSFKRGWGRKAIKQNVKRSRWDNTGPCFRLKIHKIPHLSLLPWKSRGFRACQPFSWFAQIAIPMRPSLHIWKTLLWLKILIRREIEWIIYGFKWRVIGDEIRERIWWHVGLADEFHLWQYSLKI